MDYKTTIRLNAKNIRKKLDMMTISKKIISNIRTLKAYQEAHHIMIYYPLESEVNLLSLLEDNKEFYLPKMDNENLLCCKYKKNDKLITSHFNTQEPINSPTDKSILDIIFVPALAIDKNKYRLGYGKGYYDRFLKNCDATKIIPIPEELIFDNIYKEEHDIPCDIIITQKKASC